MRQSSWWLLALLFALPGFTGSDGGFQYEEGAAVRFSIGDIPLGQAARGKAVLTPLDLVVDGNLSSPAVINIARLLQSLDAIPGDQAITIPEEVQAGAVASNELLAPTRVTSFAELMRGSTSSVHWRGSDWRNSPGRCFCLKFPVVEYLGVAYTSLKPR